MAGEEKVQQQLVNRFPELSGSIRIARSRRIFVDVSDQRFLDVLDYVRGELGFPILCLIVGLDEGENFGIIYILASGDGTLASLTRRIPRDEPVICSIYDRMPNSEIYERELVDLFGIHVTGLPDGSRYPLPDDWPEGQFPLRKDWTPDMLDQVEVAVNG